MSTESIGQLKLWFLKQSVSSTSLRAKFPIRELIVSSTHPDRALARSHPKTENPTQPARRTNGCRVTQAATVNALTITISGTRGYQEPNGGERF